MPAVLPIDTGFYTINRHLSTRFWKYKLVDRSLISYLVIFSIYNYLLLPDVQVVLTEKKKIFFTFYVLLNFFLLCLENKVLHKSYAYISYAYMHIMNFFLKIGWCWIIRFSLTKESQNDESSYNIAFVMLEIIFTIYIFKMQNILVSCYLKPLENKVLAVYWLTEIECELLTVNTILME